MPFSRGSFGEKFQKKIPKMWKKFQISSSKLDVPLAPLKQSECQRVACMEPNINKWTYSTTYLLNFIVIAALKNAAHDGLLERRDPVWLANELHLAENAFDRRTGQLHQGYKACGVRKSLPRAFAAPDHRSHFCPNWVLNNNQIVCKSSKHERYRPHSHSWRSPMVRSWNRCWPQKAWSWSTDTIQTPVGLIHIHLMHNWGPRPKIILSEAADITKIHGGYPTYYSQIAQSGAKLE